MPINGSDGFEFKSKNISKYKKMYLSNSITVGIAAYGNSEMTYKSLQALFNSAYGDYELILVDDASPDDTLSVFNDAAKVHPTTSIFSFDENYDYTESVNAILSHAQGDYVLFLSNDILVTPSYLSELLSIICSNTTIGIVRGCSNMVDNGLGTHNIPCILDPKRLESIFDFAECRLEIFGGGLLDDVFLTGDAFMVTRKLLNAIGTFDTNFVGYFSDHDFGVRAQKAGFRTLLARGAFAWHSCGANFSYLSEKDRTVKKLSRTVKVQQAGRMFISKYGLDPDEIFYGVSSYPWNQLASVPFDKDKDYCAPRDYSQHRIK